MSVPSSHEDTDPHAATRKKLDFEFKADEMTTGALLSVIFATLGASFWKPWYKGVESGLWLIWLGVCISVLWQGIQKRNPRVVIIAIASVVLGTLIYVLPNIERIKENADPLWVTGGLYLFALMTPLMRAAHIWLVRGDQE